MSTDHPFLIDLLSTPSPTGFEVQGQRKWANYVRSFADKVENDAYGSAWATIQGTNPKAPVIMLEAHADEIDKCAAFMFSQNYSLWFKF
jgi:endoglucanase